MQEYRRGATLKFGPLCISHCGLQVSEHREVLAWHQIKYVENITHALTIRQKEHLEDWATLDVSSLPNVCILEALVRHLHQMHKAMAASGHALLPVQPQNQNGAGSIDMSQRQGDMERMGGNRSILRDSVL